MVDLLSEKQSAHSLDRFSDQAAAEQTFSHSDPGTGFPFYSDFFLPQSVLLGTILMNSQDTIYFKDRDSRFILNSMAHARQFDLESPEEMRGKTDYDYFPKEFADRTVREEQEIMRSGRPVINHIEKWNAGNGRYVWFSACKYPLFDPYGKIIGTWGTSRDITEIKLTEEKLAVANEELNKLSRIDELSGLFNRRHFYERLNTLIMKYGSKKKKEPQDTFSLIVLDVDRFKSINDTLGHGEGDEAIRHISQVLRGCSRETDTAFRIGGDEFTLLLEDTDLVSAREFAENLRIASESTALYLRGLPYRLTVSIGVSCFDEFGNGNELVHAADSRLYRSKSRGRNRVT